MGNENVEILNNLNSRYEVLVEQLNLVEQQILELRMFDEELAIIKSNKENEIFTSIGKSVFAPVILKDKQKLLVDVGAGYFVRKDVDETMSVIKEQKQRIESFKIQISSQIDNITRELQNLII